MNKSKIKSIILISMICSCAISSVFLIIEINKTNKFRKIQKSSTPLLKNMNQDSKQILSKFIMFLENDYLNNPEFFINCYNDVENINNFTNKLVGKLKDETLKLEEFKKLSADFNDSLIQLLNHYNLQSNESIRLLPILEKIDLKREFDKYLLEYIILSNSIHIIKKIKITHGDGVLYKPINKIFKVIPKKLQIDLGDPFSANLAFFVYFDLGKLDTLFISNELNMKNQLIKSSIDTLIFNMGIATFKKTENNIGKYTYKGLLKRYLQGYKNTNNSHLYRTININTNVTNK